MSEHTAYFWGTTISFAASTVAVVVKPVHPAWITGSLFVFSLVHLIGHWRIDMRGVGRE